MPRPSSVVRLADTSVDANAASSKFTQIVRLEVAATPIALAIGACGAGRKNVTSTSVASALGFCSR